MQPADQIPQKSGELQDSQLNQLTQHTLTILQCQCGLAFWGKKDRISGGSRLVTKPGTLRPPSLRGNTGALSSKPWIAREFHDPKPEPEVLASENHEKAPNRTATFRACYLQGTRSLRCFGKLPAAQVPQLVRNPVPEPGRKTPTLELQPGMFR